MKVNKQSFKDMKFVPYSSEMFTRDGYVHFTDNKKYEIGKIKKKGAWGYDLV